MRSLLCVLVASLAGSLTLLPTDGAAQGVTLDEGRFLISMDGRPAGSETFAIRRSGTGADARIIAQAQIELEADAGSVQMAPAMEAGGDEMALSAYQIKISGAHHEEIYVTLGDRRFITKVRTEQGEREREYRAAPGTVLLDRGVAHQYFFLRERVGSNSVTVPVIVPRDGRQYDLTIRSQGTERISVGGREVTARRFALEGGGVSQSVWLDDEGRVLRVEDPEAGYRAVRESLPPS